MAGNILIMTFTNLEKYLYSKKSLKQRRQPPTPPAKSKAFSRRYFREEIEEQPCMEEGGVQIFFLLGKSK